MSFDDIRSDPFGVYALRVGVHRVRRRRANHQKGVLLLFGAVTVHDDFCLNCTKPSETGTAMGTSEYGFIKPHTIAKDRVTGSFYCVSVRRRRKFVQFPSPEVQD